MKLRKQVTQESREEKNTLSSGNSTYIGIEAGIASQVCPRRVMLKEFRQGNGKT